MQSLVKNLIGKGLTGLAGLVAGDKGKQVVGKITNFLGCNEEDISDKLNNPEIVKALKEFEIQELELHVKEMENARNREIKISESANATWLQKSTPSIIALYIITMTTVLYLLAFTGKLDINNETEILILTGVTGFINLILGYYFGSSEKRNKGK